MKNIKLSKIEFNTGDIILFHGRKSFFARTIQCCTRSRYSHVALVVKLTKPYKNLEPNTYVIESGYECTSDELSGERFNGVQIQTLDNIITNYSDCELYYRKFQNNSMSSEEMTDKLLNIFKNVHHKSYDTLPIDWIKAEMRSLHMVEFKDKNINVFWCSALIAYIYIELGLLPCTLPFTLVTPQEWGTEHSDLDLVNCSLCTEEKIQFNRGKSKKISVDIDSISL